MAQRLERVLKKVTRQSSRLARTPAYGSLLLGKATESPGRRHVRIQVILVGFILSVNLVGIALAYVLNAVAFPEPDVFTDVPRWIPFVVAPTYIGIAVVLGTWWIHGRTVKDLRWAIEGGPPTPGRLA